MFCSCRISTDKRVAKSLCHSRASCSPCRTKVLKWEAFPLELLDQSSQYFYNFSTSRDGLLQTSFKSTSLKPRKLYLDVTVQVVLLYHNRCRLLKRTQLLNFLEFISLPFPLSHMSSTSLLLPINECIYLHSWKIRGSFNGIFNAIVLSVVTYALPSSAGQFSKAERVALIICSAKLSGEGFVANHLPLMTSYPPESKNYFAK